MVKEERGGGDVYIDGVGKEKGNNYNNNEDRREGRKEKQ